MKMDGSSPNAFTGQSAIPRKTYGGKMAGRGVSVADVFASKALGGQILKEARSTLLNEIRGSLSPDARAKGGSRARHRKGKTQLAEEADEALVTTSQQMNKEVERVTQARGRLVLHNMHKTPYKKAVRPDTTEESRFVALATGRAASTPLGTSGDGGARGPGQSKAKLKAAALARREPRIPTPLTARRGLPLPDYPWATPERQGPGFTDPPKTGWQHTVSPPWIFEKDVGTALATDVHGQVKPGWKGRRGPREGDEPPWFEENVPKLARHERVSSIMQQMPGLSPETRDARMTLCTPDATNAMNLRARGGRQWTEYLSGSDNILQRDTDALARAVPHRDVMNLTSRIRCISEGAQDTDHVRRCVVSREKGVRRKPKKDNWTTESSNFVGVNPKRMQTLRGVQTMGVPSKKTLALRDQDKLRVHNNTFVLKKQPNDG